MTNISEYIKSGILEQYVLGIASAEEIADVELLAGIHEIVRTEIEEISIALEKYALANAIAPNPTIKPFFMATIDFTDRMQNGEQPTFPPELNDASLVSDYAAWINRPDMILAPDFKDYYAKIIGYTPSAVSAIVWLKDMAPDETHYVEYEKFLILEGSCNITIGDTVHELVAGNYMAIPLHIKHSLKVTSSMPCKVILQRIAA